MSSKNPKRRLPRWLKIVLGLGVVGLVVVVGCLAIITFYPDMAAQNIDKLRDIIGDAPVAQLEALVLNIQDHVQQLEYQLGLVKPAAPWSGTGAVSVALQPTDTPTTPGNAAGPSPTPTLEAMHSIATCSSRVYESPVYATKSVNIVASVNHERQDSVTAYAWFVNGTPAGANVSSLTYTFPAPGSYTIKLTVTMESGESPSCETTVDVLASSAAVGANAFTPSKPLETPTTAITPTPTGPATALKLTPTPTPTDANQVLGKHSPQSTVPSSPALVGVAPGSTSTIWPPFDVLPLGRIAGEGQWLPYMLNANGRAALAYRTFLEPDLMRPYSVPAVVAFDLQATRLHFVLGTVEPAPDAPQPARSGAIAASDLKAGVLLATFNGGFKARHGEYGAMADGIVALPPIDGLATVAIYADGRVQIGEWGTNIKDSFDLVAWRQNGKLLIHNGQITPDTAQVEEPWGRTIRGGTITWRSALGLSADGRTLFYVAGPELDVPTLAKVMEHIGAVEALQLDVNGYWVHFAAIRSQGSSLVAEPLLPMMKLDVDRYLKSYPRDFFYVTAVTKP